MSTNLLPHVTQEPIIEYDMLASIGEKVKLEIANLNIKSIEANEENLSIIKKTRAELNGNFKEFEERRKFIKAMVSKPYDDFDTQYRKFIVNEFKNADCLLKSKAVFVEDGILKRKTENLQVYFSENNTFDFLSFSNLGLKIIRSASDKSLQNEIDAKINQVKDDLSVIDTVEHKKRVLAKYQISKDLNHSISTVNIEIQKEKEIQQKAEEVQNIVEAVASPIKQEIIEEPVPPIKTEQPADSKLLKMCFTVIGNRAQLKALKEFMNQGGIKYE